LETPIPSSGIGASTETGSTRTRTLKLKLIYLGLLGGNYQNIWSDLHL